MKIKYLLINLALGILFTAFINYPIDSIPDYGNLKDKSWYNSVFDKSEIKQLDKANSSYKKADAYLAKADIYFKKAEGYTKFAENSNIVKEQNKSYKNAAKNEEKAIKYALKAYALMLEANSNKHDIYKSKLINAGYDTSIYHIKAKKMFEESEKSFKQAYIMYQNAQSFSKRQKYTFVKESVDLQDKSIKKQEFAIGLLMKDTEIDISIYAPKKTIETDTNKVNNTNLPEDIVNNTENSNENEYNPTEDANVYKSKLEYILSKLSLSKEDSMQISDIHTKNTKADSLMREVDAEYVVIDSIRTEAQKETDKVKSEMINQKSTELEKNAFYRLIKAANLYVKSNEIKYNFYKNRLNSFQKEDTLGTYIKANQFITSADSIYSYSESATANANLQFYKSEEYLQLMDAIQAQLAAIQQQENAFSTFYGWNISELPSAIEYKYKNQENIAVSDSETNNNNNNNENVVTSNNNSKIVKDKFEYNYAGSFEYSVENPKPDTLRYEKGIFFKIQTGVFKNLLSLNDFGKYSPISFDTYKNNPYKRFMLGNYKSAEAAEIVLKEIKEKGLKDAYIIAYVDGKRTLYSKAKNLIVADDIYKNNSKVEVNKVRTDNNSVKNDLSFEYKNLNYGTGKYDFAQGVDVTKIKGLVYGVQLGLYQIPKTNEELKMISPLMEENIGEGIKFMKGPFYSYTEAVSHNKEIRAKGFGSSFVTAYFDGKHISLTKAKSIEASQKNEKEIKTKQDKVSFSVQIGAYSTKLTAESEEQFNKISTQYIISAIADQNGLVIYIVGNYNTYEEAVLTKNELKKQGFTDGFIIAFLSDRKISVSDAIKISKTQN